MYRGVRAGALASAMVAASLLLIACGAGSSSDAEGSGSDVTVEEPSPSTDDTRTDTETAPTVTATPQPIDRAVFDAFLEASPWAGWQELQSISEGGDYPCTGASPEPCKLAIGSFSDPLADDEAVELCELVRSWAVTLQPDVVVTVIDGDEQAQVAGSDDEGCAVVEG